MNVTLQSRERHARHGRLSDEDDEVDADLINAGKQTITELPDIGLFRQRAIFAMIRGGHINLSILGALQVAENGDLANWMIPGKMVKGMGGAMDLVAGVKRVIILMDHNAKDGSAKLLKECNLPLTGAGVVDDIITELGVFSIGEGGVHIQELAEGVSVDEVRERSEATIVTQ